MRGAPGLAVPGSGETIRIVTPLSQTPSRHKKHNFNYYLAGAISLVTFLVYLPSLQNEFLSWDDADYVSENPHIRSVDVTFFRWAFFDFHASNWHPLTWISHALDYAVWGLNPLGHHLTNNILHSLNTFLVVVLVIRLVEAWRKMAAKGPAGLFSDEGEILVTGVVTGLLFGLHPLHVESVAWVAERKDLLCALFFLLSIMAYTKYVMVASMSFPPVGSASGGPAGAENPSSVLHGAKGMGHSVKSVFTVAPGAMLSALCFFALALLSKPMAVTLPAVLLILDWFPFQRIGTRKTFWRVCMEKLPFIALSLISSVLTLMAQSRAIQPVEAFPLSTRLPVAAKSLIAYLWKMMVPTKLLPFYPYDKDASFFSLEYLGAIVLVLGITAACLVTAKRQRVFLSLWGYYVVTLIPVLGIIQVGLQSMADRYTYLPSLAPFLGTALLSASLSAKGMKARPIFARFTVAIIIAAAISLSSLTVRQIKIWKNGITLWTYALDKEPRGNFLVFNNRAAAFSRIGRYDRAVEDFNKAIDLNPFFLGLYTNRGAAFMKMGQLDKAAQDFQKEMVQNPLHPLLHDNYISLGILYGKAGQLDRAIECFNNSVAINPNDAIAFNNRGYAYSLRGQYDRALEDLNQAIILHKNYASAYENRGNVYLKAGENALAVSDFRKACDLGDKRGCDALQAAR